MNSVDVTGHAADKIAALLLIVIREGQSLDVRIESAPQIVCHPLCDASGEVLFSVGTDRIQSGNREDRSAGELQHRQLVIPDRGMDQAIEPTAHLTRSQHVIEHDLQRPRLQQVRKPLADNSNKPNRQGPEMRLQEFADGQFFESLVMILHACFCYQPSIYRRAIGDTTIWPQS